MERLAPRTGTGRGAGVQSQAVRGAVSFVAALVLGAALAGCDASGAERPRSPEIQAEVASAAPAAQPALREAVIVWRRWEDPPRVGELLAIDAGGVVVGPPGGPLVRKVFPARRRVHELASFARLYGAFAERGPGGTLEFRGGGRQEAGPAARRMVRAWARLAAAEAQAGATETVYGVALVWQRASPGAAPCDDLSVSLAGGATGVTCAGGGRRFAAQLTPARMEQLYRWVDELAPLQLAAATEGPEGLPTRFVFAGAGQRPAGAAERQAMVAFAEALHAELATGPRAVFRSPEPLPPAYPEQPPPRRRTWAPAPAPAPQPATSEPPPVAEPTAEPPAAIEIHPATTEPPAPYASLIENSLSIRLAEGESGATQG